MNHISEEKLAEFKKVLEEKKDKLKHDLEIFSKESEHVSNDYDAQFEDLGDKVADNAMEVELYEKNLALEHILENDLQKVVKALGLMDEGKYGICEKCGKEIPLERLEVLPEALICTECKV